MSKVSVVIAAYNVEKYIKATVSSVICQTLQDIEIIVVDDCSTDSTLPIIESMAQIDSRIKLVHHEQNKGLMLVRKTGFTHSTGEYIMFLDGDDLLTPDACKIAYEESTKKKTDILQFGVQIFNTEKGNLSEDDPGAAGMYHYLRFIKKKLSAGRESELLSREKYFGKFNFNFVTKAYRRDLIEKVCAQIPDTYINLAEDVMFSYLSFYFATSYDYIEDKLYLYRYGAGMTGGSNSVIHNRRLEALAKSWFVYKHLANWTIGRGKEKNCSKVLERLKYQMLSNIGNPILFGMKPDQYNYFIDCVKQYGTDEEIVLALANYIYTLKAIKPDQAALHTAGLNLFKSDKKEVKTVGIYYYRMFNGGIENVMSIVSDMWVKQGYKVVIFTDCEPCRQDYPLNPAIKRVVIPAITEPSVEQLEKRISAFRRELLNHNIDIMVYNAWVNPYVVLDEMIIKSCNTKLLLHTHGLFCSDTASENPQSTYNSITLGNSYALTDMVVALTDVDLAWWRNYGLRTEKTVNPVKLPLDTPAAPLNGHTIVCSGRVDYNQKQTLQAVQVAELVKKKIPDVKLQWVGGCDDKEYLEAVEKYIKEHHLEDTVELVGFTKDVLPYYQGADVMLSTSRFEGFSLSLTEGKICGLPLVCYYLSNWDMAREPRGMVNVPQGDIGAAADAIVEILQNDELRHRMGAEARESAKALYSLDLAKHWDYIFEQTMLEKPQSTGVEIKAPMEEAVHSLVAFLAEGMIKRDAVPAPIAVSNDEDLLRYAEQSRVLSNVLEEIGRSESYRVGLLVTAIPRKIKNWIMGRK